MSNLNDELRPEYALSELQLVGRGLYAERYHAQEQVVKLDDDVWTYFQTAEAVNEALRSLIQITKRLQPTQA